MIIGFMTLSDSCSVSVNTFDNNPVILLPDNTFNIFLVIDIIFLVLCPMFLVCLFSYFHSVKESFKLSSTADKQGMILVFDISV